MSDDLGLLGGHPDDDHEHDHGHPRRGRSRGEAHKAQERRHTARRRRRSGSALAVVLVLVLAGGVYLGGRALLGGLGLGGGPAGPADFTGSGGTDVVVRIADGDTTSAIAATLVKEGVVAGSTLFTDAAATNDAIASIQPGYYKLRTTLPAATAVTMLAAEGSRVGRLVLPEGLQLDDVTGKSGSVTDGILTRIHDASCVTLDGTQTCTSVEDLATVAASADAAAIGVPSWAQAGVAAVADKAKRLEGLIRPGSYNIAPGATATAQLTQLLTDSASQFETLGLPSAAVAGLDPYQVLVTASLVQREALPADFAKVARVVYNRLAVDQKLEFDSTVNYPLDVQAIATTKADRDTVTPWNTYASPGLPATPISSPSDAALTAAEKPADGTWLYFVTINSDGTTVFSNTFAEHEKAIEQARANGVFG